MKKFLLIALSAFVFVSCSDGYIDKFEDICDETREQIEDVSSMEEFVAVMKQFRVDIRTLAQDYAEEAEKTRFPMVDGKKNKLYERRIKARNSLNKVATEKRRELMKKEEK